MRKKRDQGVARGRGRPPHLRRGRTKKKEQGND